MLPVLLLLRLRVNELCARQRDAPDANNVDNSARTVSEFWRGV